MKVCRITDSFPPPWSGLNPGPYELSVAQAKAGIELHVIAKYYQDSEEIDKTVCFPIHRIKAKYYFFEISAMGKFLHLHNENKFDVIHSHGNSLFIFFWLRKILELRIPIVVSVHCVRKAQKQVLASILSNTNDILKHDLLKEKIVFRSADMLLPVSENLKHEILQNYEVNENKIFVIGNGVNPARFTTYDIGVLKHIKKDIKADKIILFIGVLNGRKNEQVLFRAIKSLRKYMTDFKLVVVGKGNLYAQYEQLVKEWGIAENILFVEYIEYDDIKYYYLAADVFVLPSLYEGLPKVVLEAMICGKPIIASNISGNRQLIKHGENGYLFTSDSVEQLTYLLRSLLSDSKLAEEMGNKNKQLVMNKYTWDTVALNCQNAYTKLLDRDYSYA